MVTGDQRIIVQGILFDDDKVLLAKRSLTKKIAPGKYHIPGGHVEYSEHPDDAIIREFKEELNLIINPIRIIRAFSYTTSSCHEVAIVYLVALSHSSTLNDIRIDKNDNENLAWAAKKDLSTYLPTNDSDYITLTSYYKPI